METLETKQPAPTFFERNAIIIKLMMVGFISLLLLIPSVMIQNLVIERSESRDHAVNDIYSKWGQTQTLAGPILNVPYRTLTKDANGKEEITLDYLHFLPERLDVKGNIDPSIRYYGIYEAILYNGKLNFSGNFTSPDLNGLKVVPESISWKDAFITIGISDLRGIKESVLVNLNDKAYTVNPGIERGGVFDSGLSIPFPLEGAQLLSGVKFGFSINLNGSSKLSFWPLGKETNIQLNSPWTTPSFSGAFLPESREVSEKGFSAKWKVLELNRNFPQKWTGDLYSFANADEDTDATSLAIDTREHKTKNAVIDNYSFGVDLLMPVDFYQKVYRSAKYALMFIGLTFTAFFFIELVNKKRIHPVQYILVGFALVIFYTLLLSFTEHLSFGIAYSIASAATILLITWFSGTVLKSKGLSILMGSLLSALYLFLYILLQMEDYSLLIGSIGLFVILGLVMFISRKVDWYDFRKTEVQVN
ncbi:cell envelope integrity protein CreD [Solitalea longa]|uniref:Cell envelope integrity protein CreD n=1 Tax=Solitalea longa TaxID=2079460 RepID=A0A2S5A7V6_9SPHI|nr:cell envelope integrity protein CreD [Solitalea longa]POY38379.1 cell envelope integrity protein CreD [Solitalea longa]